MDPTANLEEPRRVAQRLQAGHFTSEEEAARAGERLAELVEALDEWIAGGGFLPEQWGKRR